MKLWNDVRRAVLVDGISKTEAREKFGPHDTTIQKMLDHPEPPGYQMSKPREKPKLGEHLDFVKEILEADRTAPPKQRHNGSKILERLQAERGYKGKKTAFYAALKELNESQRDVFIPLAHPPGEAQFDFGYAEAVVRGVKTKIAFAELSLPYSNVRYLQVFPKECTETFQEGLKRAFLLLGGVPRLIKFDNFKIGVKKIVGGRGEEPTREFLRIASHFLFDYHFCRIRQPQEKGHVEGSVRYSRNHHLVPVPKFDDYESFNALLEQRCREDMKKTPSRKTQTTEELFALEKGALLPIPDVEFEARKTVLRRVDSLSLVRFEENDYSIPSRHAHKWITVGGGIDTVKFFVDGKWIATHVRDWGAKNSHYNPIHYLAILERRPGALNFGQPFANWNLPKEFDVLRRRFEAAAQKQGKRDYIRVLRLLENHTLEELSSAIRGCLRRGSVSYDAIRFSVKGKGDLPVEIFCVADRPLLNAVRLPILNLDVYNEFAKEYCHEKNRNEIHGVIETSLETVETCDDGARVRGNGVTLCEGKRGSPVVPSSIIGTGTSGSGIPGGGTAFEGGSIPNVKTLENFDFKAQPSINKMLVNELMRGVYIAHRECIVLIGSPGTGKTHLATAFGVKACQMGKNVRFFRVTDLITKMMEAREERTLERLKKSLASLDVLILDELGYVPANRLGSEMFFEVISAAYERTSVIVTTNLPFPRWTEVLGDQVMTGAVLDRLTHRCHILEASGASYRLASARKRFQKKD